MIKKNSILLYSLMFTFLSCGTMEKSDRISQRNDFFNKFSRTKLKAKTNWKMGDDILVLRKNNSFRYYSKVFGLANSGYYTGVFEKINDSIIVFDFYKNYKPPFFTNDTLKICQKENFEVLENDNADYLVIFENELK